MRHLNFIKSGKRKIILKDLQRYFGVSKIPNLLVETSGKKVRAFSGSMNREEIESLNEVANIEIIGLYLCNTDSDFRLSLDACHIFSEQINKNNILEISDENVKLWINGKNLDLQKDKKVFVIRSKNTGDYIGCGISDGKKIINCVSKDRWG